MRRLETLEGRAGLGVKAAGFAMAGRVSEEGPAVMSTIFRGHR